jgi:multidrug resistance protein, MATE family
MLIAYVLLISPSSSKCWGGFGKSTIQGWGLMVKLSVPGISMMEAEWFVFALWTLAASHLSATELAAQSVIMTVFIVMAHIPFSVAVAVDTRLGILIGCDDLYAAKVATRAGCIAAVVAGASAGLFVIPFRRPILNMFTEDEAVISVAPRTILVLAVFQIFDSTTAIVNGLLRGIGRQSAGAWINLVAYYLVRFLTSTELLLYLSLPKCLLDWATSRSRTLLRTARISSCPVDGSEFSPGPR